MNLLFENLVISCIYLVTVTNEFPNRELAIDNQEEFELGIDLCAEFILFPDNTAMPTPFTLAGYTFSSKGNLMVNESGGDKGLQFDDLGMEVELPVSVDNIELIVGAFNTQISIQGFDSSSNPVASLNIASTSSFNNYLLKGKGIKKVVFTGGGSEGTLKSICLEL